MPHDADKDVPPATAGDGAAAPIRRTLLQRHAIPGTDEEMQLTLVEYQPGVSAPLHHHPVAGLVYVVEGTVESAYGNDPPRLYHAGDSLQDLAEVPHTLFRNANPDKVLRFLVFTKLRSGQPYLITP